MKFLLRNLLAAGLSTLLIACGTNPVTGESELQLISTNQEIQMGEQAYAPGRQMQGGDYVVDPALGRYVQQVNDRLARVSDRDLPYEIHILNSSVPNAWALPGGKMAINRGLLTELKSEAELAAVLGHEVVHAAARHGARAQERGLLLQSGVLATAVVGGGTRFGDMMAGGAMVGAQLLNTRYGRDAELQADHYGMEYMVRAGYNPNAAVDLQQTFVRLSEGRKSSWLEGLFASHPPSEERVERNKANARRLGGADLDFGRERYQQAIAGLKRDLPAYQAHDQAVAAANEEKFDEANTLADRAIHLQPAEPKFHGLKGDLAFHAGNYRQASSHYNKAIALYPDYFAFHLRQGYTQMQLDNIDAATRALERSNEILPTANAQKALGDLALKQGNEARAVEYYSSAARSDSATGREALAALARLELEDQPAKYLKTRHGEGRDGKLAIAVYNLSPLPVNNIVVAAAFFDAQGNQTSEVRRFEVKQTVEPEKYAVINTGWDIAQGLRSEVESASLTE